MPSTFSFQLRSKLHKVLIHLLPQHQHMRFAPKLHAQQWVCVHVRVCVSRWRGSVRERQKVIWIKCKRAPMYSQVWKKLQSMCSKFNRDIYNYERSGMERACQKKQVFGNLLELCLYCYMDPRNDRGSGSCSTWWLMPILLQLALPGVDQRTPRVSSSCPTTLGSSLLAFLEQ